MKKLFQKHQCLLFIISTLFYLNITAIAFDKQWNNMQEQYKTLMHELENQNLLDLEQIYCHPFWYTQKEQFKKVILGQPNKNCWQMSFIGGTMIRAGFNQSQEYELCYLKNCLHKDIFDLIKNYKDTNFNGAPFECTQLNCSTNTLGHLFYAGKILEHALNNNLNIENILEFGGGYGNLVRILKSLKPESTIAIVDLPEFLSLQYLFLRATLPNIEIIMHSKNPTTYKKSAIHLVPVFFLENIKFNPDVFISTFGISEAPQYIQEIVTTKKFFDATISYLSGQLNGWGNSNFVNHINMLSNIQSIYSTVFCQPFHIFSSNQSSYEIIGYDLISDSKT